MLAIAGLAEMQGLVHGFSTSLLGSMHRADPGEPPLTDSRRAFAEALEVDGERISYMGAVHGTLAARVDEPAGVVDGVDILVTDRPGLPLFATFADCYPIVLFSAASRCAALAHAGWRGTAAGVAQAAVAALAGEYRCDPAELVAGLGPGICGRCYEVGEGVGERFLRGAVRRSPCGRGRVLLNLAQANRLALIEAGLEPDRIFDSGVCTLESTNLYSHRRDGDGTRFAGLVALP